MVEWKLDSLCTLIAFQALLIHEVPRVTFAVGPSNKVKRPGQMGQDASRAGACQACWTNMPRPHGFGHRVAVWAPLSCGLCGIREVLLTFWAILHKLDHKSGFIRVYEKNLRASLACVPRGTRYRAGINLCPSVPGRCKSRASWEDAAKSYELKDQPLTFL